MPDAEPPFVPEAAPATPVSERALHFALQHHGSDAPAVWDFMDRADPLPGHLSDLQVQGRVRERKTEVVDIAPGQLAKAERAVEAHRLLVGGIDLKGQFPVPGEGMGNELAPDTHALPVRGDEEPADETAQQADEADGFPLMAGNPGLGRREIVLLDQLALLHQSRLADEGMRRHRGIEPDIGQALEIRCRIIRPDQDVQGSHENSHEDMQKGSALSCRAIPPDAVQSSPLCINLLLWCRSYSVAEDLLQQRP